MLSLPFQTPATQANENSEIEIEEDKWGAKPGEEGAGGVRKAGEERVGGRCSSRVGSGRNKGEITRKCLTFRNRKRGKP